MTDRTGDVTERSDPVLVRPYITTEPGRPEPAEATETWPETATLPEDDTAVQPVVAPAEVPAEPKRNPVRWALRFVAPIVVLVVALGIAGYFVLGGSSRDDARRGPSAGLPTVNPPAATGAGAVSAGPSSSPSKSASASGSPSTALSEAAPPPSAQQSLSSAPVAGSTLAPPPATARTGRLTSAGGRCLTLGGLFGIDGSPIQAASCIGGTPQQFTLATDGTLQVAGRCAAATGDATVRSTGCGAAGAGGQWRAGPAGSLVNPSTGQCLTDPGAGGATTRVEACTGGDGQRWTLP